MKKNKKQLDRLAQGKEIDRLIMLAFEQYCQDALKLGQKRAVKLARKADKEGMTPGDVARFADLLDQIDLEPEDVTPLIIHQADVIHNKHCDYIRAWIKKHADGGNPPQIAADNHARLLPKENSKDKRPKIFGFPVTAVIRWMGAEGYNFLETKKVLKKLHIDSSDITIKIQLKAGKDDDESRGEPAPLTKKQANEIFTLVDE